jgi:rhombotail lipoprotein
MKTTVFVLATSLILCAGCAYGVNPHTVQRQSNLASYLFGDCAPQQPAQKVPLTFPSRVGVTFVPNDPASPSIPETAKKEMIDSVRSLLAKHTKYVAGAQNIPSTYLSPKGGVCNLEQVARQFDVDVIVLLGANQFQNHERNPIAAFMDITIIGAFVIPGNTVNTSTVLEAAVYHVPSRSLIFRTDGTDKISSRSTQFGSSQSANNDAVSSIENALKQLVVSIGGALAGFEKFDVSKAAEIKPIAETDEKTGSVQQNYWGRVSEYRTTGGGAFDSIWIIITGVTLLCTANKRKQR